jgi:hypothetical protein
MTARLQELALVNRYYGTAYTLQALDEMEEAQVEQMITLAEEMQRG